MLARPAGLEPAAPCLEGTCSIHLSYGRKTLITIRRLSVRVFNDFTLRSRRRAETRRSCSAGVELSPT